MGKAHYLLPLIIYRKKESICYHTTLSVAFSSFVHTTPKKIKLKHLKLSKWLYLVEAEVSDLLIKPICYCHIKEEA